MNQGQIETTVKRFQDDWNLFADEVLGAGLDKEQKAILSAIQNNSRVVVSSGNARGKDYVGACASLCHSYLYFPSKTIETGPTARQVEDIMFAEIKSIHRDAKVPLGGEILSTKIRHGHPAWFLEGFKASDKAEEDWSGYHSPHMMIVITEASKIEDETVNAIEGLMAGGDCKLVLIGNPIRSSGPFYDAFRDDRYTKITLSCLNAPNVVSGENRVKGQVTREWVEDKIYNRTWCSPILEEEVCEEEGDFFWKDQWYRPGDLFRMRVLGLFPRQSEGTLVPLEWVRAANEKWYKLMEQPSERMKSSPLRLGVDVAGMGRDATVLCYRYGMIVSKFSSYMKADTMETAGRVDNALGSRQGATAFVDTIGEGSGVYSSLKERGRDVVSVKGSEAAKDNKKRLLTDATGEFTFANMRAYLYWAVRDALNPRGENSLALPPNANLTRDLTELRWKFRSDGKIIMEDKDALKGRLKRSPDEGDSLAVTFCPNKAKRGYVANSDYDVMPV